MIRSVQYAASLTINTYVCIDLSRTIVLVSILALSALHTAPDLRSDADAVSSFDILHVSADSHGMPYDLMPYDKGKR
jgi:hypothetical protein